MPTQGRTVWQCSDCPAGALPLTQPDRSPDKHRNPMSKTYRALLVGTGSVADSHARAIEALQGRVKLVTAVDIEAERVREFCARHKIADAQTDYAAALRAARPDIVLVAAPPAVHAAMSIAAME